MARHTPEDDKQVEWFERQLRGEKRVLLSNAPRHLGGLKKLTDWQIYCLAAVLSLTDAVIRVRRTTFDKLERVEREALLHAELLSYDEQRNSRKRLDDPAYWSEFMQKYLRKDLRHDVPA
jgi:hypothetical protein